MGNMLFSFYGKVTNKDVEAADTGSKPSELPGSSIDPVVSLEVIKESSAVSDVAASPELTEIPTISHQNNISSLSDVAATTQTKSDEFLEDLDGNNISIVNTQPITTVAPIPVDENTGPKKNKQKKKKNLCL